jgi:hypothetical protein
MFVKSNAKLTEIKKKLFEYMKKYQMDLDTIFSYLDKDKSRGITIVELTAGLSGTKKILTDEECRILF